MTRWLICIDHSPPAPAQPFLAEAEPAQRVDLEPVDSVEITTVMDNVTDLFMTDQGPARRIGPVTGPNRASPVMAEDWIPDALIAEQGFSVLVAVRKGERVPRLLFDAETSPDGVVENMRRLSIDPGCIEAIVCRHAHFDHTTGLDGLIRALGMAVPAAMMGWQAQGPRDYEAW